MNTEKSTIESDNRLSLAIDTAKKVGGYQVTKLGEEIKISTKSSPIDLVTEVDIKSQEMIVGSIQRDFPDDKILAEEGVFTKTDIGDGWSWIVDPLDGTTNYSHGFPIFCVSIGIYYQMRPKLGIIYAPFFDELFVAKKDCGAFLNDKKISVSDHSNLITSMLATGFPYDKATSKHDNIDYFSRIIKQTHAIRRLGSAALDLAFVACGRLDGYWELKLKPWDVAAGFLILTEAGGKITNIKSDTDYNIFNGELLATNGTEIHDQLNQILGE